MNYVNPLTFFNSSSIIDYGIINRSANDKNSDLDIKKQFLAMLLEKVYLKDFKMSYNFEEEDADSGEVSIFKNDMSDMVMNGIFREQLAKQMIDSGSFDLGLGETKPK